MPADLKPCPFCGGFGFTSTPVSKNYGITVCRAKTCELCHGAGVIAVPMTNADRIRAMTDEELVNLHYSGSAHCIADDPTVCDRHDFIGNLTPCEQCYLKWLQMPAEDADHRVTVDADDVNFGVDKIPSADVTPVRHGRWIETGKGLLGTSSYKCSDCEFPMPFYNGYNYCPNCGCRMDGGIE